MRQPLRDLGQGVWQFQTPLWQTNALLAIAQGEALLCDPSYTPAEIEGLRDEVRRHGAGRVYLLITHGDFDHTCGIGYFPEATVVAGPETAQLIATGIAGQKLRSNGAEWGAEWLTDLRVDRVVEPGTEFSCGPFRIAALDACGHQADGLAYVLLDQGILLPGDYLSSMTYPFSNFSLEHVKRTCEGLLAALDRYEVRWVVPGHGPALTPDEARAVGEADLAYVERVTAAARAALAKGLSPGLALVDAYAVEPSRPTTHDFEVYNLRAVNARQALAEAQEAGRTGA